MSDSSVQPWLGGSGPMRVAYFSMEIALESSVPTYSGGLGVLAGDTLRAAADLGLPMCGVTLLYRKGYFRQHLDEAGGQSEEPSSWAPERVLERLDVRATVRLQGRDVSIRPWRYVIRGAGGHELRVYLLDTDLEENHPDDRTLTDALYGGDSRYRLAQEVVLGFGGVAVLRALGHRQVQTYHMNEGHCAFVPLALLEEQASTRHESFVTEETLDAVRRSCVFTTHTPEPAGHDRFSPDLVRDALGESRLRLLRALGLGAETQLLNMTELALHTSRYVNGVAMRHGHVSRLMFPGHNIASITNGVHAGTWTSEPFQGLYDRHLPGWRTDSLALRSAIGIPLHEVRETHAAAKAALLREVRERTGVEMDAGALTLGFARRAAEYKRADLLFRDLEALRRIVREHGPLQVIYAGKAHPADHAGKAMIRRVFEAAAALRDEIPVVYLEQYDMDAGRLLCSGVDLWLNTPEPPREASGTSGMKAALNGVPSLSILDGWWVEGHVEGVTGWSIGSEWDSESNEGSDWDSLYHKLGERVAPLYYRDPEGYARVMRSAIALNGSFFNSQRMVIEYVEQAYRLA